MLALPVDELALAILADVAATNEWSAYNWMIAAQERAYGQRSNVLRALAEAWGWLRANGLVARNPVQSHGDAIFVTRLGRRVLDEGVALARAMRRLALDLHPTPTKRTLVLESADDDLEAVMAGEERTADEIEAAPPPSPRRTSGASADARPRW